MRLILIRHAQCHSNVEERMLGDSNAAESSPQQGDPEDELTSLGKKQAQALGTWLAQQHFSPTHLYSSPLRRTHQTWQWIQQACKTTAELDLVSDRRLTEINQGIFTGLTWPEAQALYPQLCTALEQSLDWRPVPDAESPLDCRKRAQAMVSHWRSHHRNEDCLWVVSHSGFLSHLVSELLGCDRTWGCTISPTGLFEFELDLSRWSQDQENRFNTALWKINRFNSNEHLSDLTSG